MRYKLVALDLDGTTIGNDLFLTDVNRNAVNHAIEQGMVIAIITGKMFAAALPFANMFNGVQYLFASNGANVYDMGAQRELCSYPLEHQYVENVISLIETFGLEYRIYTRDAMFATQESELVQEIRTHYPDLPVHVSDTLPSDETFYKIYAKGTDLTLPPLMGRLRSLPVAFHPSGNLNVEITSLSANKGSALRYLKRLLGLSTEDVVAMGNHENDLPMFKEAGLSVAVADAPSHVKQQANLIAPTCGDNGVAYVLNAMLEGSLRIPDYTLFHGSETLSVE